MEQSGASMQTLSQETGLEIGQLKAMLPQPA
jgi:lambda repressor-like predicted transcriptional regulator